MTGAHELSGDSKAMIVAAVAKSPGRGVDIWHDIMEQKGTFRTAAMVYVGLTALTTDGLVDRDADKVYTVTEKGLALLRLRRDEAINLVTLYNQVLGDDVPDDQQLDQETTADKIMATHEKRSQAQRAYNAKLTPEERKARVAAARTALEAKKAGRAKSPRPVKQNPVWKEKLRYEE